MKERNPCGGGSNTPTVALGVVRGNENGTHSVNKPATV
jgi:hypothetical protein